LLRGRRDAVNGVRAIAALSVVAVHIIARFVALDGPGGRWYAGLNLAVPVFFVVSGVVIYRPFVAARAAGRPRPDLVAYGVRRAARIIPAYWAALIVLGHGAAHAFAADWWRWFFFMHIYDARTFGGGLGVSWSVCVEVTFYASAPLFAAAVGKAVRRRPGLCSELWPLAVLGLIGIGSRLALSPLLDDRIAQTVLPSTLLFFAAGMTLAVLDIAMRSRPALAARLTRWSTPWLCWPAALGLFAYAVSRRPATATGLFATVGSPPVHIAVAFGAALVVLPALPDRRSRLLAPLRSRVAAYLGTISYGIYLWHSSLISTFAHYGAQTPWLLAVCTGTATLAIAHGSWRYVERPAIAAARRFTEHRAAAASGPGGAVRHGRRPAPRPAVSRRS
jgi:peptidoglycan/LPS O-acetylase OafA/YrhL